MSGCHILLPKCHIFAFHSIWGRQEGFSMSRPTSKDAYACLRLRVAPSCTPRLEIGHILNKKCHILFRIDGFGLLRARRDCPALPLRMPRGISTVYLTSDAQTSFFRSYFKENVIFYSEMTDLCFSGPAGE